MENEFDKRLFAARLKEIRKSKSMTQEKICELTGIEISNYSKIETGKVAPSLASLLKIIDSLKITPNDLFEYNHLEKESDLDKEFISVYESLNLSEKRLLYKIVQNIKEFK